NISDKGTFVARDVTGYTGLDFSFKRTTNNVWCGWYPEAIESNGLGPVEFLIGAGEFRLAGRGLSALGRGLSYFGRNAAKGGGRAFWSGAGSEAKALAQGFQTLGQTRAGKNLARLTADMPYYPGSQAYYMWARLSKKYAQGAKGTVHVFQNAEHGVGMESIWRLYEYPALLKNPNVTDIIFHY
ncbi:hypothetical protein, partial [Paraflavitalea sp. sgz302552]|uniref:hypothetical protein n=2 Tax=unclassified Paraflavitalea TaxID=2798305 RepID=UPI003D3302B9